MKSLLVGIAFLLIFLKLIAQENSIQFKKLDINNGLSSNLVNTIFKDSRGYLWIGTVNGLNCYDGNSIRIYRKSVNKEGSIIDNNVTRIFEDNKQRLLITTLTGLSIYDPVYDRFSNDDSLFHKNIEIPKTNIVEIFIDEQKNLFFINRQSVIYKYNSKTDKVDKYDFSPENGIENSTITGATIDKKGNIWLINQKLDLIKFDLLSFKIAEIFPKVSEELQLSSYEHGIFADSKDNIWIYSRNEQEGLVKYNTLTKKSIVYKTDSKDYLISNNIITVIVEDNNGNILVGTDHGGLNLINSFTNENYVIKNDPGDKNSIVQNSIICLFYDDSNILWVGTYKKGISFYHPDLFRFKTYTQHPYRENWLEYEDVNTFAEDNLGNLWIGTNGGGLVYFNRERNTFKTFRHNPNDKNSLSSDVIVDICLDHDGGLWIGTYMGGLNYFDGHTFKHFFNDPANENSISSNNVWSIYEDNEKNLWVGTLSGGVDCFKNLAGNIQRKQIDVPENFKSLNIMSISGSPGSNIWFATSYGIGFYNKSLNKIIQILKSPEKNSIVSNTTLEIKCDHRGLVWIGTREGLNMYNPKTGKFSLWTERDGLPGDDILTILEDEKGNLWLGTPRGLCNLIITEKNDGEISISIKNYDEKDGLHGKTFNEHAALKTSTGELVFGGPEGFSIFKPDNLVSGISRPKVVFSGFEIQNKPVEVGQEINKRILLHKSLNQADKIKLKHFEKTFSISFASLNFINPEKTNFHYMMEGFNSEWITTNSNSRKVTYTNLHPGEYTFRLFSSNIDNSLKSEEIILSIEILPPFWKTKWAYSVYLIIFLCLIFITIQQIIKREKNKFLIQQERLETAKVHEMDMLKLKFFTNISHEIRTPLTLILSPLEKIIKTTENVQNREQLKLIQRNAKRLLTLINQLLDFRRLEVQGLSLLPREEEFVSFCKETAESFSDLSESRNIQLTFSSNVEELKAFFDYDKIEKILFNLLSNAFKFTPEGGKISLSIHYDSNNGTKQQVLLKVSDNGIGIPTDKQEIIFERFVQNLPEGSTVNKGSGIGLSLSREFAQMHGGTITVQSKIGEGSCFEVCLPLKDAFEIQMLSSETQLFESKHIKDRIIDKDLSLKSKMDEKFKVLLVEDNPDIRFYLKDNLKSDYQIIEAVNGLEAWDILLKEMPELIVSDIMMPIMDGIEFCRKIKTDNRTSHIPVILLTARTTDQQKYEGLETGADDYITKPFNFEVLELKIRSLIEQRKRLKQAFHKNLELQPSEISITSLDDKFLRKIKEITVKNMHEPNFSVEKLSLEFGISRAHLYNKLLALTGKTPIEYIRILRIRRAAQLLEKSQLTVMEIAYKVGFNDPRYFTKHFKNEYNMTPSQYAKKYYSGSFDKEKDV